VPDFVKVASVADIPPGTVLQVDVRGHRIALANVEGEFFAVDDTCPHRGGPLGMGFLDGMKLECPLHAWQFDLRSGEFAGDPAVRVATYQVRIEGGDVLVAV
jgi:nitrite reductase (NADH) small subunit